MKIKNINTALFAIALAGISAGITSCKDEPDKYETTCGIPTIDYIRPVEVGSKDSLLTAASLNNTICIIGRNLRSVKEIDFNDQKAVLNTSYMTDNSIIVTVPKAIPEKVTDKIYFITTGNDTINYDFKVTVPAPSVVAMSNEWAPAGEEVTISGDYFMDYDNCHLTIKVGDNYTLPYNALKISKSEISFIMPEDMPKHEPIYVTSIYGTTKAAFQYMDNRGMLFDFDTPWDGTHVLTAQGWHASQPKEDEYSLSGKYYQMGDADLDPTNGWNDEDHWTFNYWAGTWNQDYTGDGPKLNEVVDFADWNNKSLKFEIYVPEDNPWETAPMQFMFAGTDVVNLFSNANNSFYSTNIPHGYYMPWNNDEVTFNTGGHWRTVTIPLSEFNKKWDGNKLDGGGFTSVNDFASLSIYVNRGMIDDKSVTPTGNKCHPIIKIDNIRVVPNK